NFISLGIGNGKKDKIVIKELMKKSKVKYFPIDISLDMLEEGMRSISDSIIETTAYISDFKNLSDITERVRKSNNVPLLMSILGNTLGNFGQIEILNTLKRGMTDKDFLLIESTMRKEVGSKIHGEDIKKIVEDYNNSDFEDFAFTPLKKAGFKLNDGIIEVEYGPNPFYPKLSSIEVWFHLSKDKIVNYEGSEIVFKKGERIRLYVSHKYTKENLYELLDGNGFEVLFFNLSEENDFGITLCKLKN
ncbi:hypothetical protein HON22_04070, partial [Candidatus Peregrinibacteria bacterium]|nr:hypothetical protein [Candidatus Peregrinibacteria bacterium]